MASSVRPVERTGVTQVTVIVPMVSWQCPLVPQCPTPGVRGQVAAEPSG